MSPADRNKVIIGAAVIVVVVAVVFLVMRSRRPAPPDAGAGGWSTATGTEAGGAGAGPAAPGEAPGQVPRQVAEEAAALEGAEALGEQVAQLGPLHGLVRMGIGSEEQSREDPTETFEPPPQPTPEELKVSLPPVTLYEGGIRPGGPLDRPMIGGRRVAGLLFNDQAWAILEDNRETFIVKPGDVVAGIRVTAIARDSIYVEDEGGNRWTVSLRGLGPSARAATSTVSGMPALPPAAPESAPPRAGRRGTDRDERLAAEIAGIGQHGKSVGAIG